MPLNVMLVDDSATVRLQARRALAGAGFRVIEACDGLEALEKLGTSSDIVLVVCDVNMPRMNGIEFIEALSRQGGPKPAVIMLTTERHPELIQRAKAHGAKDWIAKPFNAELLVAAVKKVTGG